MFQQFHTQFLNTQKKKKNLKIETETYKYTSTPNHIKIIHNNQKVETT